jgi:nicotinamidase-related amidase
MWNAVVMTRAIPGCALLLVDVISDFSFDGGADLLRHARRVAAPIANLRRRLKRHGVPIIYANDNRGQWRSDFRKLVVDCAREGAGADVVRAFVPDEDDYFILKPKHSPFFATPLALLLQDLSVDTLVICGFAGDGCVVAAATDAHMRDYRVFVPVDCIASETPARNRRALAHMRDALESHVRPSAELTPRVLRGRSRGR